MFPIVTKCMTMNEKNDLEMIRSDVQDQLETMLKTERANLKEEDDDEDPEKGDNLTAKKLDNKYE